ncbi:SUF system NifU family Fe-S cluster assembly protein [bacterium]|jgi:nitrogen fixation NifU-like protein|nr:SUF system NifU family Fe-S cluster assembly protein [Gemmatimonadota bacterium]MCH2661401.1 SUF system NifU family Fe-S cluster assembly protein [bacterium]|tara:strand:+ start:771 stop:1223 length:453 start_codon:yes stop_codon:yes gene_type:complete
MTELRELYQQIILDHNKNPRNFGKIDAANRVREGYNPLCGDHLHVYLHVAGDTIADISFEGSGCAISKASASLMTAALKGKPVPEAVAMFEKFQEMVTAEVDAPVDDQSLGKMAVFAGVREFPMRVKCATLAWHTMKAAVDEDQAPVSTE